MMQMRAASERTWDERTSAGMVTLRAGDWYLNLDGSGFTRDRAHAYRGSIAQARKMRQQSYFAKDMKMVYFRENNRDY